MGDRINLFIFYSLLIYVCGMKKMIKLNDFMKKQKTVMVLEFSSTDYGREV